MIFICEMSMNAAHTNRAEVERDECEINFFGQTPCLVGAVWATR